MRLHQIKEDDLADLERILPQLAQALMPALVNTQTAPRLRVLLRRSQTILSDVRWNYGPPQEVETVSDEEGAKP